MYFSNILFPLLSTS